SRARPAGRPEFQWAVFAWQRPELGNARPHCVPLDPGGYFGRQIGDSSSCQVVHASASTLFGSAAELTGAHGIIHRPDLW
ncbi:hypothetical protein METBIDRAFT_33301, partial [Metschnikowia bicuspidata var. bicuspidata NRRL YB-4993]